MSEEDEPFSTISPMKALLKPTMAVTIWSEGFGERLWAMSFVMRENVRSIGPANVVPFSH